MTERQVRGRGTDATLKVSLYGGFMLDCRISGNPAVFMTETSQLGPRNRNSPTASLLVGRVQSNIWRAERGPVGRGLERRRTKGVAQSPCWVPVCSSVAVMKPCPCGHTAGPSVSHEHREMMEEDSVVFV